MKVTSWVCGAVLMAMGSSALAFAEQPKNPVPLETQRHMSKKALLLLAKSLEEGGAIPGAIDIYQRLGRENPKDAEPMRLLGDIYARIGNLDLAKAALAEAARRNPEDLDVQTSLAKLSLMTGDIESADATLTKVLEKEKKPSAATLNAAGVAKDLTGDVTTARRDYALGLDVSPENPAIKNNMALSFAVTGDYPTAIGLLKESLDIPERAANARRNLAIVYALSGQMDEALKMATGTEPNAIVAEEERHFLETLPKLAPNQRARAVFLRTLPPGMEYKPGVPKTETRTAVTQAAPDEQTPTVTVEAAPPGNVQAPPQKSEPVPTVTVLQQAAPARKPVVSPPPSRTPVRSQNTTDVLVVHESQEAPMKQVEDTGPNMLAAAMVERATIRHSAPPAAPETTPAPKSEQAAPEKAAANKPAPEKATPDKPATKTAAAKPEANGKLYRLQLGAFPEVDLVKTGWSNLMKRHAADLKGMTPVYATIQFDNGKTYYRLYAGTYSDFSSATAACTALSAKNIKCLPIRSTAPVMDVDTSAGN